MLKGFLVITDLSGYTAYLRHSELEPAVSHLQTLLDILIANTSPPLIVSKMEGDAVLSYALEGTFLQGQTLVEMVEITYVAFRQALDQLILNNQCDCNACQFVPDLDLKFFVHYGNFLLQPLGGRYVELVGNDVNLLHRLTKNRIVENTGYSAYVAYTEQAVQKLQIENEDQKMLWVVEGYDHIGEVNVLVQDMHEIWEKSRSERLFEVGESDALARFDSFFPASQILMWDTITMPEFRFLFSGSGSIKAEQQRTGRVGAGNTYQCIDGRHISTYTIRSWDPPRQYTYETDRLLGTHGWTTISLEPLGDQTHVTVLVGKGSGRGEPIGSILDRVYRRDSGRNIKVGLEKLKGVVLTG